MLERKRVMREWLARSGVHGALERLWPGGRRIAITRHRLPAPVREPVRIAHVTDLHVVRHGTAERQLIERLADERPDAIVFSGDFTSPDSPPETCGEVLRALKAPRGVWTTLGNWDYWHPVRDWPAFLAERGVRLLRNSSAPLVPGVWLAGLDSAVAGSPDPELALAGVPPGGFAIALIHCPVLFDEVAAAFPLCLAGHTHGGQIRVPGLRPLYMPAGCWPYSDGWYERHGSRMYVNRGIGTPGLPIRVACPPEIAIFTLAPDR